MFNRSRGIFMEVLAMGLLALFSACSCSTQNGKETAGAEAGLHPIDIKAPKFFWMLKPWKEGKLATIDGWGRFAEISFKGTNKMKITSLVNFPRSQVDGWQFETWPDAGLIAAGAGKTQFIAAVDDNKTKSHIPLLSWVHRDAHKVLLDANEGLVGYCYPLNRNTGDVNVSLFVYNYKEDRMVYESRDEHPISWRIAMDGRYVLSNYHTYDGEKRTYKRIFHDWRTGEIVENDLTKAIDLNGLYPIIETYRNIHPAKRRLFGNNRSFTSSQSLMITWGKNYEDVKVTPLSYLLPEGFFLAGFILSADGAWGATFVGGYRGLRDEILGKRAFFHLDEKYPNGISMPIITEDYSPGGIDYSAFVEHPVHGLCHASEWHKDGKLYLRLYKMSEVLAEIERQL